jgi:two-component system OmpR family sensor kinase
MVRSWRTWTLRTRMVVAVATLAAVALVAANIFGIVLLRSSLVDRLDNQLTGRLDGLSTMVPRDPTRSPPTDPERRFGAFPRIGPVNEMFFYDANGTRIKLLDNETDPPAIGSFDALKAHAGGRPFTVGDWRVAVRPLRYNGGYVVGVVSLQEVVSTSDNLLAIDAAVTGFMLLLIAAGAATVVRVGLRPLTRMEQAAADIAAGDLSRRVDDADPHTESGRLGTALNTMLGRIEEEVEARTDSERKLRRFLADASHELRTPLTSIQGFAELYRRGGVPAGPELDEAMGRIEGEVSRMRLLVNDLLLLARLDEERPLECAPVDLLSVAADAVRDAHVRVPTRFVFLDAVGGVLEPVTVVGDEARLRQVVTNLVTNALQHTPESARVELRVGRFTPTMAEEPVTAAVGDPPPPGTPVAVIEVEDTGPGMLAEDAGRVFERLYRAEHSRARVHGGAGLGLSIAAAIVKAHDGRVELLTAPGCGARFRVLLPAEPDTPLDDS